MPLELTAKIQNFSQPVIDTFKSGIELFKKQTTPVQITVGVVAGAVFLTLTGTLALIVAKIAQGRAKRFVVDPAVETARQQNVADAETKFNECSDLRERLKALEAEARAAVEEANTLIAKDLNAEPDEVKLQIAKAKYDIKGLQVVSKEAADELDFIADYFTAAEAASGTLADVKAKYFDPDIKPSIKKQTVKKLTDAIANANAANSKLADEITPLVNVRNEYKLNKELLDNLQNSVNQSKTGKITEAEKKAEEATARYNDTKALLDTAEKDLLEANAILAEFEKANNGSVQTMKAAAVTAGSIIII